MTWDTEVLVLAENADGSGRTLEIQRSIEPSEQDRRLGQDGYCIVVNGAVTNYGGVDRWEIADGRLTIGFSDAAASTLGVSRIMSVGIGSTELSEVELRRALHGILRRPLS